MIVGPHSTKLPQSLDTESHQLGVPACFYKIASCVTNETSGCFQAESGKSWMLRKILVSDLAVYLSRA